MIKNISGQKIGSQMVSATDGSAFTGSVTCYPCGDAGTQALGTVGSGVCVHEGNGFHTYTPSQAETNFDHLAFTFIGTGAIPATVQTYTILANQTGDTYALAAGATGFAAIDTVVDTISGKIIGTLATGTHNPQTGDAYAVVNDAAFGNSKLVRSTTPANTLTVDANHLVAVPDAQKVDVNTIKTNPVVNAGTVTFPTTATLASTTNLTAGTVANVTNGVTLAASQHVIVDSGTVTTLTNLPTIPANWITATGITAAAFNGKGDWNIGKTGYTLSVTPPTAAQVRTEMDSNSTKLANLDAAVSSRSTYSGGAVASVTAAVTVGTNSDKTGYSLSVTPPTALAIRQEMDTNSTKLANLDATVSSRSTYSGGAVSSVTAGVTVSTNNDKTGYALATTPPTAAQVRAEIDSNSTQLTSIKGVVDDLHDTDIPAIHAHLDHFEGEIDTISGLIGALTSTSGRCDVIMPTEVIKAPSGDKYIECFVQLYDASRVPMNAHDMDGGNYSTNATYNLNERVKPTANNPGADYFQITTIIGSGTATEPDWSTAQTPAQTCTDGDGNTWTNIGATTPSTTALYNGLGITCADDAGVGWELYSNNTGTPLLRVNECHHWDQTNRPQIASHTATGLYAFWLNADAAETDRTIYLTVGWFDKSRFEAGYSASTDHRRVVFQTRISSAPTLSLAEIEGSTVLAKEATVGDVLTAVNGISVGSAPTVGEIRQELDDNSTKLANLDVAVSSRSTFAGGAVSSVTGGVTVSANNDKTGYALAVAPATATQIRAEMDTNSEKLANLDAAISTRSTYAGGPVESVTSPVSITDAIGFQKNVALNNFTALMVLSADHVTPATGKSVTGYILKDSGAFVSFSNSVAEVGNGIYRVNLTQAEMNADFVTLAFMASGCDQRTIQIKTSN